MALTYTFTISDEKRKSFDLVDETPDYGDSNPDRIDVNYLIAYIRMNPDGTIAQYNQSFDPTNTVTTYNDLEFDLSGWYYLGVLDVPEWDSMETGYIFGDIVYWNGEYWAANINFPLEEPSDVATDWKLTKDVPYTVLDAVINGSHNINGSYTENVAFLLDIRAITALELARPNTEQLTNIEEYNRLIVFDYGAISANTLMRYPQVATFTNAFYDTYYEIQSERN